MLDPGADVTDGDLLIERIANSLNEKIKVKKEVQTTGLISDLFDKGILSHLEDVFGSSESGENSLTAVEFKELISKFIPVNLVENIYRAIDVNDVGFVNYSDFTNYLISAEAGLSYSSKIYATRLVMIVKQEDDHSINHKDFIDCMTYVSRPCPMIITGGRDGQVCLWDPDTLKMITSISHRDKTKVYQEEMQKSLDTYLKAHIYKKSNTEMNPSSVRSTKVAITVLCPLMSAGLLCVGSADCCLTIYDIGTQEVCGRFPDLQFIPTAIECFCRKQNISVNLDNNRGVLGANFNTQRADVPLQYISIGDSQGYVHFIRLHPEFGLSTEVGMKKKNQILFAHSIQENYSRTSVNSKWVTSLKYIFDVDSLITASVDGTMVFVDVARNTIQKTFNGHKDTKIGINCFSWSSFGKYIVSAADRTLLFWDLFTLEINYKIENLLSPVIAVTVVDSINKIFGILSHKTVLTWHNITYECLQSFTDPILQKPKDLLSAMVFSVELNCLFTAGNRVTCWKLERAAENEVNDDEQQDLVTALYNQLFNQVVLVFNLGLVKIYQAESGEVVRRFSVLPIDHHTGQPVKLKLDKHTGLYHPVIQSAQFDKLQSRLVVTSFDLTVQFWNLTDGTNLIQQHPQLYSTTLAHIYANLPRRITAITHEIFYSGVQKIQRKLVVIGTQHGNLCGYQESNSVVEEIPIFFLRLSEQSGLNSDLPVSDQGSVDSRVPKNQTQTLGAKVGIADSYSESGHSPIPPNTKTAPRRNSLPPSARKQSVLPPPNKAIISEGKASTEPHIPLNHYGSMESNFAVTKGKPVGTAQHDGRIADLFVEEEGKAPERQGSLDFLMEGEPEPSAEFAVLWVKQMEDSQFVMVAYVSGVLAIWDLEKNTKVDELPVNETGPVLGGMRKRGGRNFGIPAKTDPNSQPLSPNRKRSLESEQPPVESDLIKSFDVGPVGDSEGEAGNLADLIPNVVPGVGMVRGADSRASALVGTRLTRRSSMHIAAETMKSKKQSLLMQIQRLNSTNAENEKQNSTAAVGEMKEGEGEDLHSSSDDKSLSRANVHRKNVARGGKGKTILKARSEAGSADGSEAFDPDMFSDDGSASRMSTATRSEKSILSGHFNFHEHGDQPWSVPPSAGAEQGSLEQLEVSPGPVIPSDPRVDGKEDLPRFSLPVFSSASKRSIHRDSAAIVTTTALKSGRKMTLRPTVLMRPAGGVPSVRGPGDSSILSMNSSLSFHSIGLEGSGGGYPSQTGRKMSKGLVLHAEGFNRKTPFLEEGSAEGVSTVQEGQKEDGSSIATSQDRGALLGLAGSVSSNSIGNKESLASSSVGKGDSQTEGTMGLDGSTSLLGESESQASEQTQQTKEKIQVDSLIILPESQVIIGACSDRYLRFWDLNNHHILCSCVYYHQPLSALINPVQSHDKHHHHASAEDGKPLGRSTTRFRAFLKRKSNPDNSPFNPQPPSTTPSSRQRHDQPRQPKVSPATHAPIDEVLRALQCSDSEDVLIGAYDNGKIRIWTIQSYSIVTLRNLLNKHLQSLLQAKRNADIRRAQQPMSHLNQKDETSEVKEDPTNPSGLNPLSTAALSLNIGTGMTISPITLLLEFQAHNSPIINIDYVWFDYEKPDYSEEENSSFDNNSYLSHDSLQAFQNLSKDGKSTLPKSTSQTNEMRKVVDKDPNVNLPERQRRGAGINAKPNPGFDKRSIRVNRVKREKISDMGQDLQEGFILSAGLDQKVFLWSLQGKCVGEFGSFGWDINNESTWRERTLGIIDKGKQSAGQGTKKFMANRNFSKILKKQLNKDNATNVVTSKAAAAAAVKAAISAYGYGKSSEEETLVTRIDTSLNNITRENVSLLPSPSSSLIQNIGRRKKHSSAEMNNYVEVLTKKILMKPPSFQQVNQQFTSVSTRHPIVSVSKLKKSLKSYTPKNTT